MLAIAITPRICYSFSLEWNHMMYIAYIYNSEGECTLSLCIWVYTCVYTCIWKALFPNAISANPKIEFVMTMANLEVMFWKIAPNTYVHIYAYAYVHMWTALYRTESTTSIGLTFETYSFFGAKIDLQCYCHAWKSCFGNEVFVNMYICTSIYIYIYIYEEFLTKAPSRTLALSFPGALHIYICVCTRFTWEFHQCR